MTRPPSYRVWCPALEQDGSVVSIFLTRGGRSRPPEGGRAFFEAVLSTAGVTATLDAWGVEPFLTSYFSRDWEECWEARLLVSGSVRLTDTDASNGAGVDEEPSGEAPSPQALPVRVLADFTGRDSAERCRAVLAEHSRAAKWGDLAYDRYEIRKVGRRHWQLAVDVTTAEPSQLSGILDAAEDVRETCETNGGRTHVST